MCEYFNYTVPLNELVAINKHIGNHNRNYYFTLKVSNNAQLQNIEHIDILVDDSPPEVGVVYEGIKLLDFLSCTIKTPLFIYITLYLTHYEKCIPYFHILYDLQNKVFDIISYNVISVPFYSFSFKICDAMIICLIFCIF